MVNLCAQWGITYDPLPKAVSVVLSLCNEGTCRAWCACLWVFNVRCSWQVGLHSRRRFRACLPCPPETTHLSARSLISPEGPRVSGRPPARRPFARLQPPPPTQLRPWPYFVYVHSPLSVSCISLRPLSTPSIWLLSGSHPPYAQPPLCLLSATLRWNTVG
jgi:hypothetical protein